MSENSKVYSYIRMSSEIQVKHGESHRRQLENIENWCKANNKTLDTGFKLEDLGVSAFKGANIQHSSKLGQFLQAIQDGKVGSGSTLLVESLDRISRQEILKSLAILQSICDAGITVHTLSDGKSYNAENINDIGSLIYSLLIFSRSNEESRMKAERLKKSWASKFNNIENKILTRNTPFWISYNEDKRTFYLNDRVNVIRKIFEMSISGYGNVSIIKELHKHPDLYSPLTNSGWNTAYIQYCLNSPATYGTFFSKNTPQAIDNYFPEAVTYQEFLLSQDARQLRKCGKSSGRKGNTYTNLFTRLMVCGECGSNINYYTNGKNSYLRCMRAKKSTSCVAMSWEYEQFQESFLKWATEINLNEIFTTAGKQTEIQISIKSINETELLISAKQKNYASIIDDITNDAELSKNIKHAMGRKADAIEIEIFALKESLNQSKIKLYSLEVSTDKHIELVNNIEQYNKLTANKSDEELRAVRMKIHQSLCQLVKHITFYNVSRWNNTPVLELQQDILKVCFKRRYKTEEGIFNYMGTDAGQRLYNEHNRFFTVLFKNGQKRNVIPSQNYSKSTNQVIQAQIERQELLAENLKKLNEQYGIEIDLDKIVNL